MHRTCSCVGSTSAGRECMTTSAVQLRLRALSSEQVDGGDQPAQLRLRRWQWMQRTCAYVGGSGCSGLVLASVARHLTGAHAMAESRGPERISSKPGCTVDCFMAASAAAPAATQARQCGSGCSGLAAALAVRPPARVHENQRSCACGLSAHSRSMAGKQQPRRPTSVVALASVAVNAADLRSHRWQ